VCVSFDGRAWPSWVSYNSPILKLQPGAPKPEKWMKPTNRSIGCFDAVLGASCAPYPFAPEPQLLRRGFLSQRLSASRSAVFQRQENEWDGVLGVLTTEVEIRNASFPIVRVGGTCGKCVRYFTNEAGGASSSVTTEKAHTPPQSTRHSFRAKLLDPPSAPILPCPRLPSTPNTYINPQPLPRQRPSWTDTTSLGIRQRPRQRPRIQSSRHQHRRFLGNAPAQLLASHPVPPPNAKVLPIVAMIILNNHHQNHPSPQEPWSHPRP
jgi:hypothetical protein